MKRISLSGLLVISLLLSSILVSGARPNKMIGVNVVLNTDITNSILADLGKYGKVRDAVYAIDAVTMQARESNLNTIRALPYVAAANPDAEVRGAPVDTVAATDFTNGLNTWDQDAINVTDFLPGPTPDRVIGFDGSGVYVAVLDTGLADSWRQYFPQERIAEEFAIAFGGGGGNNGTVSTQPNKWEHDQHTHGTHVTSTILGYSLFGTPINGTAPKATVIPVKVLNQNGFGWESVVARGIVYVADLKANGELGSSPVVINMSLGGPADAMVEAAVDYAIEQGVIVVASAGNEGEEGMGYPGAYPQVISAAASGWVGEWAPPGNFSWWFNRDVADPTNPADFYITDFSSRELAGQDLDVAAPGSWVVGPFQLQSGKPSYFFLGGTSMASPHVAGIAALMMQKNPSLTQPQVEAILESSAIPLPAGCRMVLTPFGPDPEEFCWDTDATGSGLATADAALAATP
ncbi:MAG TPA: S8 family serine peptidase [Anaerolineales bacterium]|nr:S8 family serine peptidase [Anaerolineales bacterium]